jgi:DNA-3-methyladenine glycosylase
VYFTYGMHYCLNVVTGLDGQAEAVLIRAIEPLLGTELMRFRRGLSGETSQFEDQIAVRLGRYLGAGPAKLCQSLGIRAEHNGIDLTVRSELWICESNGEDRSRSNGNGAVVATPRIGITKAVDLKRRFTMVSDQFTSRTSKA